MKMAKLPRLLPGDFQVGTVQLTSCYALGVELDVSVPCTISFFIATNPIHVRKGKQRAGSVSDLTYMISKSQIQPIRSGAIASFPDKDTLTKGFNDIAKLLPSFDAKEIKGRHGTEAQPPNVLYIALRIFDDQDDQDDAKWRETFIQLVDERKPIVSSHGIRRISFLVLPQGAVPLVLHPPRERGRMGRRGGHPKHRACACVPARAHSIVQLQPYTVLRREPTNPHLPCRRPGESVRQPILHPRAGSSWPYGLAVSGAMNTITASSAGSDLISSMARDENRSFKNKLSMAISSGGTENRARFLEVDTPGSWEAESSRFAVQLSKGAVVESGQVQVRLWG